MKKAKICAVAILIIMFVLSLVGCTGKSIEFREEIVPYGLNNEVGVTNFQMVDKISSVDELNAFFNTEYFGMDTSEKLTMFDRKYFENNDLLFLCYPKCEEEKYEVKNVSLKGRELFVRIERNYSEQGKYCYSYKFITVAKENIKNAEKFSYIIISK